MTNDNQERLYQEAAEILRNSKHAIAFTGAGISVPSGIPDFRSPGGLWSKYNPIEVASAQALEMNPKGVWEFMVDASDLMEKSQPNPAHYGLAQLEHKNLLQGIITQNIDNLHQRAKSRNVVEFHGNFQRFYCQKCRTEYSLEKVHESIQNNNIPVYCSNCNGLVRPDVVFFGEAIPWSAQTESSRLVKNADAAIIAGTSGEVAPANTMPKQVKMNKGKIIEINLGPTYFSDITDVRFDESVDEVLPKLAELCLR